MKLLDTTQETTTSWSPYKVETRRFQQEILAEMVCAICTNIVSMSGYAYSPTTPYYIAGDNFGGFAGDGFIFYGNELFRQGMNSGSLAYAVVDNTPNSFYDPTTFSDASVHNIHLNRFLTYSASATGSLFAMANVVNVAGSPGALLTLGSNWSVNAAAPAYSKMGKRVFLRGSLLCNAAGGNPFTISSSTGWPSVARTMSCTTSNGGVNTANFLNITPSGIAVPSITSTTYPFILYLDGLNYEL